MLHAFDDPLPTAPQRVLVAGTSGAGKSTLARDVARTQGLPYTEIDALFHGPNWEPRPTFLEDANAVTAAERWVTEWQYSSARPLLSERADTLLWLDYPRHLVMWRVTRRTVWRWLTRAELWNGNRERSLWGALTDKTGIIRWAWDTHRLTRERVEALLAEGTHLMVVRLRSPHEARLWLERHSNENRPQDPG